MPRFFNPDTVPAPASRYSQGVLHAAGARRLVIAGQVGLRPDGSLAEGLEAQIEAAFDNLLAVIRAGGMEAADLIKLVGYVTVPGSVALFRQVRERKLGSHAPAATYLEIAGLASPAYLVEVEGEAVRDG